jgi:hypothetical protein
MKGVLLYILIFISCGLFSQTNYYVKNGGSDVANGLSDGTAWATIAKVNSETFSPGDSILFEKGGIWRNETLIPSNSGTANNYITYSSYGTGIKPRLFGSIGLTSFEAHPSRSNVYRGTVLVPINPYDYDGTAYVGSIFFSINDSIDWADGLTQYEASLSGLTENFKWTWQNDSIYFYYNGSISNIDTIECTQISRGINLNAEYLTFDGLDMRYWGSRCIGNSVYPEATRWGIQIRNCYLAYTSSKEEGVGFGIALYHSDMVIENNIIHSNGRRNISIDITNGTNAVTMRDVIIQNNEIYDGYHTTGVDMGITGSNHTVRNIVITKNSMYEYPENDNGYNSNMVFLYSYGDLTDVDSIYVTNNTLENISGSGIYHYGIGGVFAINNTFTTSISSGGYFYTNTGATGSKATIMNNLFCAWGNGITVIEGGSDDNVILDTCDYNLYFTTDETDYILHEVDGGNYRYTDWSAIQGLGYDLNSQTPPITPHLNDSIYDLRPKSTSPAIGAATPVSWVTTDKDGNDRSLTAPTIGAYEYTSTPITPTTYNIGYLKLGGTRRKSNGSFIVISK